MRGALLRGSVFNAAARMSRRRLVRRVLHHFLSRRRAAQRCGVLGKNGILASCAGDGAKSLQP